MPGRFTHTAFSQHWGRRNWGSKILKASNLFKKGCWEHLKAQNLWYFTSSLQHREQRIGFSLNSSIFRDINCIFFKSYWWSCKSSLQELLLHKSCVQSSWWFTACCLLLWWDLLWRTGWKGPSKLLFLRPLLRPSVLFSFASNLTLTQQ